MKFYIVNIEHNEILSNEMHNPADASPRYFWYGLDDIDDIIPFDSYEDAQVAVKNEKKAWKPFRYDTTLFKIIDENELIARIL
jgi:hypothetical protein